MSVHRITFDKHKKKTLGASTIAAKVVQGSQTTFVYSADDYKKDTGRAAWRALHKQPLGDPAWFA
jgi:hypothetical protein